ncbi:hypothetical protein [Motilimonas sp. KMU-193]|uniref:hypothetical protein n=1 Tax=Motilimonas sp. KMU-193 TaxID=3388668 RepID=UPI00396B1AFC
MKKFQFFVKQDTTINLNTDSANFEEEQKQLLSQGFIPVGEIVQQITQQTHLKPLRQQKGTTHFPTYPRHFLSFI